MTVHFRQAGPGDAPAVAALHADSWQRHYRGGFSDDFLDGDAADYLATEWAGRLADPSPRARTILAEHDGELVGFSHTRLAEDPAWGALIDNLHVRFSVKRQGIGSRLLARTASAVVESAPSSGLYLWVLELNVTAQAFYSARGGVSVERALVIAPGGDPARLNGSPAWLRYVWRDPSVLTRP